MKSIITIVLITLPLLGYSQNSDKSIIGSWKNSDEEKQTWKFEENGRIEIIINCGGTCEGSDKTFYVDEAGTWKIENEKVYLTINENNGKAFEPAQKLELPIIDQSDTRLVLMWKGKSKDQEMNFEKIK